MKKLSDAAMNCLTTDELKRIKSDWLAGYKEKLKKQQAD